MPRNLDQSWRDVRRANRRKATRRAVQTAAAVLLILSILNLYGR